MTQDFKETMRKITYTSFAVINESSDKQVRECDICEAASSFPYFRIQLFNENSLEEYYRWVCSSCLIEMRKTGRENA